MRQTSGRRGLEARLDSAPTFVFETLVARQYRRPPRPEHRKRLPGSCWSTSRRLPRNPTGSPPPRSPSALEAGSCCLHKPPMGKERRGRQLRERARCYRPCGEALKTELRTASKERSRYSATLTNDDSLRMSPPGGGIRASTPSGVPGHSHNPARSMKSSTPSRLAIPPMVTMTSPFSTWLR